MVTKSAKAVKVKCVECGIVSPVADVTCTVCGATLPEPKRGRPRKPRQLKPTIEQFRVYQAAYDYFNRHLFDAKLKPCLLVFREGKKKKGLIIFGHFAPHRWSKGTEACHEISLNPETLTRPLAETMATLVHEMVHQWQQDHGDPPRSGYHDREWAAKMLAVGLTPTDTGHAGGKMTGQRVTHMIDADGAFRRAFEAMPAEIMLPWTTGGFERDPERSKAAPKKNKVKYTCPGCAANVWGKAGLVVVCGPCDERFEQADADAGAET
jgi:ribosomal protein S27E